MTLVVIVAPGSLNADSDSGTGKLEAQLRAIGERERLRCLKENTVVPGVLAEVLADAGIRWGHVSSGCIYDGVRSDGLPYEEDDPPNFAFNNPRAGWYSRTKAMAETMLRGAPGCLIWRMRIQAWRQTGCAKFASPDDAAKVSPAGWSRHQAQHGAPCLPCW